MPVHHRLLADRQAKQSRPAVHTRQRLHDTILAPLSCVASTTSSHTHHYIVNDIKRLADGKRWQHADALDHCHNNSSRHKP